MLYLTTKQVFENFGERNCLVSLHTSCGPDADGAGKVQML